MARQRKRLIVQADLTSETDQPFLAWIQELRRRRRLSDEIRQALRLSYLQAGRGQQHPDRPPVSREPLPSIEVPALQAPVSVGPSLPANREPGSTTHKLKRLLGSL